MTISELSISAASVEIFIFFAGCAALCADLFIAKERRPQLHWAVVAALVAAAAAAAAGYRSPPSEALNGFYVSSPFAALLKTAALLAAAGSLAFSRMYLQSCRMLRGEFLALALFSVLGMLAMISAGHFLSLYMGLELMSLCLYAMIAMRRDDSRAAEAAIKYFVLGAIASGLFLYGASIIYGATGGKLYFDEVSAAVADGGANRAALILGLVFLLAGLAFKLGAAPFHMWLPDVYEGAPAPMTLFVAAAPKVAALALALRVLFDGLGGMQDDWRDMLIALSLASLAVGNITAIAQTDIKRMLAYSAIAHSGFMLLGVLSGGEDGAAAALFYAIIYALTAAGGFGAVVLLCENGRERSALSDLRGMGTRNLPLALSLSAMLFSMAGIPPFAGFIAKLTVLQAAVAEGLIWLAALAVVFSAVGAFYYLRAIKIMFFESPDDNAARLHLPRQAIVLLILFGGLSLILGLLPGGLLSACAEAARLSF